ncbi:hypothetical protein FRC12_012999 [Ceratobasidium sp. 428]|nr:hypothetical protein FRC12_012999 [Ceratobasidium sp. 428]
MNPRKRAQLVMQSYPYYHHQLFAPPPINSDYNSYDIAQSNMSNVAVSQFSPVINNSGPYPQSCIPTHTSMHPSVLNLEASFPNQAPPTPAAYRNQVPPGQPWARPMPEQVQPSPVPAQQYQAHHRRRSNHTSQEYTQNVHRRASIPQPSYNDGYSGPNHGYAPTAPVAQFQPQQQGYVPPPTHVSAYHQHQAPVANTFVPHNYQHAPVQYQNTIPLAGERTYGTYAPQGHVGQVHDAQNNRLDPYNGPVDSEQELMLVTSFDFAAASAELSLQEQQQFPAEQQNIQAFEHQRAQQYDQSQVYEQAQQYEQPQRFESPQNYQHFKPQQPVQRFEQPVPATQQYYERPQNRHVEPAQGHHHQYQQPVQFHHHAPVQHRAQAQPQQFVPLSNPNVVPQGYAHHQHQHAGHTRRASYREAPREQASYQHASPPAAKKARLERQQRSQSIQMTGPPSNPLQYPTEPVQYASSPQPGDTQTTDIADVDQPEPTPERREAIGYQRELEDQFLKRLWLDGEEVEPGYAPSDSDEDDEDDEDAEFEDEDEHEHEHEHKLQYPPHQHQHQGRHASPHTAVRVQPIVPSQAHERAMLMPVASSISHTLDVKKEVPAPPPPPKKPALACLFCRKRKIACGPPPPDSVDKSCNQCLRRKQPCEYPTESRRGIRKTPKEPTAPAGQDPAQPTVHKFVHGDGSSMTGGGDVKGKGRRKRVLDQVD